MRSLAERPPIAVTMMAKNAEGTIARAIDSVGEWVSEFCLADTGSTDRTVTVAESACKRHGILFRHEDYGPDAKPDAYAIDAPETFDMDFKEYSHHEFLIDWIGARQASLDLASQPFVLVLDDDETLLQAEMLGELVKVFLRRGTIDVLNLPTNHDGDLHSFTARVGRRNQVKWGASQAHQIMHSETGKTSNIRGACVIHDHKDRTDPSTRVPERALKVAYLDYCAGNRSDRLLYYLAMEARSNYPDEATAWFMDYFDAHDGIADEQWASAQTALGELHERGSRPDMAKRAYQLAAEYVPIYPEPHLCLARMALAAGVPWEAIDQVHMALETTGGDSHSHSHHVRRVAPYQLLTAAYMQLIRTDGHAPRTALRNAKFRAQAVCRVGLQIHPGCPVLNRCAVQLGLKRDAKPETPLEIQIPIVPVQAQASAALAEQGAADTDRPDGPGVRAPESHQAGENKEQS